VRAKSFRPLLGKMKLCPSGRKRNCVVLTITFLLLLQFTFLNVLVEPLTLISWVVWAVDDVVTHYLSDSSITWIYVLKNILFDLVEALHTFAPQDPSQPTVFMVNEYSYERIRDLSTEPVVFRGLFSNASAITTWTDIEYLNRTIGSSMCPYVLTNADHFELHRVSLTYSQILDILTNESSNTNSSTYVSGDQLVLASRLGEQLLVDMELHKYLGARFMNSTFYSKDDLYFFLGQKGTTGTPWHCARHRSSFFLQIVGRKRWTLIHPRHSVLLRPQRSHLYTRILLGFDKFRKFRDKSEKNSGCDDCSINKELFRNIPRTQVILEPGDILTVPSWYWHHVENLDDTSNFNINIGVDIDTHVWNHQWIWAFFPQLNFW